MMKSKSLFFQSLQLNKAAGIMLAATLLGASLASSAQAAGAKTPLFLSMTNNKISNALVAYTSDGSLVGTFPTNGKGGVAANAGAVEVQGDVVAVPDFGSNDVAIFVRTGNSFKLRDNLITSAGPVSVAFGDNHLYVLETDKVESFKIKAPGGAAFVSATKDGSAAETMGNGSAGQIGFLTDGHVIYTEKNNNVSEIAVDASGTLTGNSILVTGLPQDLAVPLGLATKDAVAVVTNAHGNNEQEMLIANGAVVSVAAGPASFTNGSADCWNAIFGQFVYSANSPKLQLDRFSFSGSTITLDKAPAASLPGVPTDVIASTNGLIATIWGANSGHVTIFQADDQGNLVQTGTAVSPSGSFNGAAWSE